MLLFLTPDRQILLGSRRHTEQSAESDLDPASSTGSLLELARSMAYIRQWELWKPRRTIKFVSFGGHSRDVGMYNYIKVLFIVTKLTMFKHVYLC
jgi:hypothetical protein